MTKIKEKAMLIPQKQLLLKLLSEEHALESCKFTAIVIKQMSVAK